VALKYPDRVRKVAVVGSPINGNSLSFFLKLAGTRLVANAMLAGENQPLLRAFIRGWSPFVSRPHPGLFYDMTIKNAAGFSVNSFFTSISSLRRTNLTADLSRIQVPALGIYGMQDVIVNPNQAHLFRKHIPTGRTVEIRKAGHFPMWDTPDDFYTTFRDFMAM
jgi:pimeloyl-ACP methyl ester carboxylesterase